MVAAQSNVKYRGLQRSFIRRLALRERDTEYRKTPVHQYSWVGAASCFSGNYSKEPSICLCLCLWSSFPLMYLQEYISWEPWGHQESKGEKQKRKEKPVAQATWMQRLRFLVMWKAGEVEGMGSQPCFTVVCFLSKGLYDLRIAPLSAHWRSVTCLNIDLCNHCRVKHDCMCICHNACSLSTRDTHAVISNSY